MTGESQLLSMIRMWAAIAWADGVLAEEEAEGLRRVIQSANLTRDERDHATRLLEEQVSLPETYLTRMTPESRRGVYRAACRMAIADRELSPTERRTLEKMRDLLGVPADIAQEIEADVPGVAKR